MVAAWLLLLASTRMGLSSGCRSSASRISLEWKFEMMIPSVIETTGRGERIYDIYSLLLKERVVFVGSQINDQIANLVVAQLLWLDPEESENEIKMYIQSPGGEGNAGFAIYDTVHVIRQPLSHHPTG